MTALRQARSKWYDGALYGHAIEPLLDGVHQVVVDSLPPGPRVLEACCGTGGLARRIARSGRRVVGVDLAPRNIAVANRRRGDLSADRLNYVVGDVAGLAAPDAGPFDAASIVLALHEMPERFRGPVLRRLVSLARKLVVVDFSVPMPWNAAGLRNRAVEAMAGPEHFSGFLSFTRAGGLPALFAAADIEVEQLRPLDAGTLTLAVVRAR